MLLKKHLNTLIKAQFMFNYLLKDFSTHVEKYKAQQKYPEKQDAATKNYFK